jgi:hypothetical protein
MSNPVFKPVSIMLFSLRMVTDLVAPTEEFDLRQSCIKKPVFSP